ncbi:MerR family transcriptional regulator [Arenicella xantha]|uniref:MerR family transcriptional regulator n=1 Tax=Arenicella xantha TaxID=644221 RepID=A0A395JMY9_9GAMM|nr:MerR family DNA-binding transcriptional regulator [Arenicella xantha]RBP53021.1 MerR family transcriptional regulator [Arenicella xantha]
MTQTNMTKRYSIRELAEEFDITTRALRFYEEKGLLTPTRSKQTRTYGNADRTRLRLILRGKRLGLTLEESSDIIRMYNPGAGNQQQIQTLISKIRDKRAQLILQQQDLEHMLLDLADAEERCLQALNDAPQQRKA